MESSTENIFSFESKITRAGANNRGRDDAFFICTGPPLSPRRTEISRSYPEAIAAHKSTCEKCSRIQKERQEESQLKLEGPRRLDYILNVVANLKPDVDYPDRLRAELDKKKERGEEVDYMDKERLRLAEYDSGVAKAKIERERIELYRLLYEEQNETIRQGAKESYRRYISGMKKLKKEKEAVTPLSPSSPSFSSLKRSL